MSGKRNVLAAASAVVLGVTLAASGGTTAPGSGTTTPGGGTAAPGEITLRISNEMAPAGAMVQMKVLTTEVMPISGGRPGFGFDGGMFSAAAGFGMFATGDLAGAAVVDGLHVTVAYTTNGALTANYPLITAALWLRPDVAVGTRTLFTFDPGSIWNVSAAGPVYAKPIPPATVSVGGTVAISDVVPGEGVWPAGTVVSVRGVGFSGQMQLRVNDAGVNFFRVVSANELQFALTQATQIRGLRITVQGAKNTDTYYAYMRGLVSTVSSRTLLAATEPIFSVTPRTVATFAALGSLSGGQYQAVALQNPTADHVAVDVSQYAADGTLIIQNSLFLEGRHRLSLEVSELLWGVPPLPGSTIVISASAPIDAIGLLCDEGTWTVSPFLSLETPR